ncbi:MAG: hypothetical protein AMJ90_04485 [candidate division Zixibacteria bacterium SM23_73_2]|nr:MAG: hypothetical protein AMJ90_04485 [candidate division Zixibacteria bacterium SM23_73_2]
MAKKLLFLTLLFLISIPAFAQIVDTSWVRRYNGPGNGYDKANALTVDSSGNVYVTGYSYGGSETSYDYATIKYYPNGDTAWVRRYNGPADGTDAAHALAVDRFGNVYVTGASDGSGTKSDFTTIKYYPDGDTVWVRRYNGAANSWDDAKTIALDGSGYIYVAGDSWGTHEDYLTIKYDPDGNELWVRRYNGPGNGEDHVRDMALDNSGNVYLTGGSDGGGENDDYLTIKYYADGDTAWIARFDGPAGREEDAAAIAVDESGSVYITGGMARPGRMGDYATIKYYPNGDTAWLRWYSGDSLDFATDIALDDSGNVYVSGTISWENYYDYATVKYDSDGNEIWACRYNGSANLNDRVSDIAVSGSGQVYVTGFSDYSWDIYPYPPPDYATLKYYSDVNTAWVRTYNGPGDDADAPSAIAIDNSGNVYVTGYSYGNETWEDYATIKYVQFYLCGDVNSDREINLSDPICLANYYFGNPCEINPWSSDVNCDILPNLGDAIIIANVYFGKPGFELNCCE